jgi:hypothetical protein
VVFAWFTDVLHWYLKEGEGLGLYTLLQVWGILKFLRDAPA